MYERGMVERKEVDREEKVGKIITFKAMM